MSEVSHQSLYQKYRPHTFDDVVGQDFVKKILMNSCRNNKIHHGYIFFGFHGTGKTTLARIFAQTVNCTDILPDGNPCEKCANCIAFAEKKMIDVIEIDAASYTGVDNIREVIEHAKFTPTQGKYKIYIIDEVHMLSKGAFNALLKTLEEPPKHVIFLLATTEINKVPDTVLSRVIRFDLEKINDNDMRGLLEKICKNECIQAESGAINLIIHRSRGSLRDSLTTLEKCILDNTLTQSYVESALHLVNQDFLAKTLEACITGDGRDIQEILETIRMTSIDVRTFAGQMTEYIVNTIETALAKKQFQLYKNAFDKFTRIYVESRQVSVPMDILTMSLCECITSNSDAIRSGTKDNLSLRESNEKGDINNQAPPIAPVEIEEVTKKEIGDLTSQKLMEETKKEELSGLRDAFISTSSIREIFLQKILEGGVKQNLMPLLRTADIILENSVLTIKTTEFAEKKCRENENWGVIEKVGNELNAQSVQIMILSQVETEETKNHSPIDAATEIFG